MLRSHELLLAVSAAESQNKSRIISSPSIIATDSIPAIMNVGQDVPVLTSSGVARHRQFVQFDHQPFHRHDAVHHGARELERRRHHDHRPGRQQPIDASERQHRIALVLQPRFSDAGDRAGRRHRRDRRLHPGKHRHGVAGRSGAAPHPDLGAAFGSKSYSKSRTELIVFLTPRVIYDTAQIQDATDEIKGNLKKLQKMMRDKVAMPCVVSDRRQRVHGPPPRPRNCCAAAIGCARLVRPGSESRAAAGCEVVAADPLDAASYRDRVAGCDTFVHLVGVAHPSPAKAAQFRSIDLASAKAAVSAATSAGVRHFVYVSVAHPAPVMRAYIAARMEAEEAIRASGLRHDPAPLVRPRPRPPLADAPAGARSCRRVSPRLGLVTVGQMIAALAGAVEHPPNGVRIVEVPEIRSEAR